MRKGRLGSEPAAFRRSLRHSLRKALGFGIANSTGAKQKRIGALVANGDPHAVDNNNEIGSVDGNSHSTGKVVKKSSIWKRKDSSMARRTSSRRKSQTSTTGPLLSDLLLPVPRGAMAATSDGSGVDDFELGRNRIERSRSAQMGKEWGRGKVLTERNVQNGNSSHGPSAARLEIQELRVPLTWSLKQHFRPRNDDRRRQPRYCLFALLSCASDKTGGSVACSQLARGVHAAHTDVQLVGAADGAGLILLVGWGFYLRAYSDNILPCSQIHVEVYATREDQPSSGPAVHQHTQLDRKLSADSGGVSPRATTPTGATNKGLTGGLRGSLTRSLGAKFGTFAGRGSQQSRPSVSPNSNLKSPSPAACASATGGFGAQFQLVASAVLALDESVAKGHKDSMVATLEIECFDDAVCPPLDVMLCCRVRIDPISTLAPVCSSYAEIRLADGRTAHGHFDLMSGAVRISGHSTTPPIFTINAATVCQLGRQRRTVIVTVPLENQASQQFVLVVDDILMWHEAFHIVLKDIPSRDGMSDNEPFTHSPQSSAISGPVFTRQIDYRCLRAPWQDASVLAATAPHSSEVPGVQLREKGGAKNDMGEKRARRRSLAAVLFGQKGLVE